MRIIFKNKISILFLSLIIVYTVIFAVYKFVFTKNYIHQKAIQQTYLNLKEKKGENYYIEKGLISSYLKTSDLCPLNVHVFSPKDHISNIPYTTASPPHLRTIYHAWRPAYLSINKIYVATLPPVIRVGNHKDYIIKPLTKELWVWAGKPEQQFELISQEHLKNYIQKAIHLNLAYCSLKPGDKKIKDQLITFVDSPYHANINDKGALTISARFTGEYFREGFGIIHLNIASYRPEWSPHIYINGCLDKPCLTKPDKPYIYLNMEPPFPFLLGRATPYRNKLTWQNDMPVPFNEAFLSQLFTIDKFAY